MTDLLRHWDLPRAVPSASQLDISMACIGSRELPNPEPPTTPAMEAGRQRHLVLQRWTELGCPDTYPEEVKGLAPVERLPRIAKHEALPGVAEVYVTLDPVLLKASVLCVGRRPRKDEYQEGAHLFHGGLDAMGLVDGLPTVVEWKSRTRNDWQPRFGAAAMWLLLGKPERVVTMEVFHPSAFVERNVYTETTVLDICQDLARHAQELLAQRAGFPTKFLAGPHCRYARCFDSCPIRDAAKEFRPKSQR